MRTTLYQYSKLKQPIDLYSLVQPISMALLCCGRTLEREMLLCGALLTELVVALVQDELGSSIFQMVIRCLYQAMTFHAHNIIDSEAMGLFSSIVGQMVH